MKAETGGTHGELDDGQSQNEESRRGERGLMLPVLGLSRLETLEVGFPLG